MKIGVSSCLLGEPCRFNGEGSKFDFLVDTLKNYFELVPYCPEMQLLGKAPRESIRMIQTKDLQLKFMTNATKQDITQGLKQQCVDDCEDFLNHDLCGFLLKAKSPTCGLERVRIYQDNDSNAHTKKGVGVFAQTIQEIYPNLPIEEDGRLNDPWLKESFVMQIFAYKDWQEFKRSNPSTKDLVEFHSQYKYLLYAKNHERYKQLGHIVANHEKKPLEELLELYEQEFMQIIKIKGTINNTYNVLMHVFGYFKKYLTKEEKQELLQSMQEFKEQIIPLIAVIKAFQIYIKLHKIEYLEKQKFFRPYPNELALRSDIKAYK